MEKFRCHVFAMPIALLPSFGTAEVCLNGLINENGLLPSFNDCGAKLAFRSSFATSATLDVSGPSFGRSTSGKPQVGIHFYGGDFEELQDSVREINSSLDAASQKFEGYSRSIACSGAYDAFLTAGGSLDVTLTALRNTEGESALHLGGEPVVLMNLEIEIEDCEAN
jgi:hypothetical protein